MIGSKKDELLAGTPTRIRIPNLSCHLMALAFAAAMVLGQSFYEVDSWDLVFGSAGYMVSSVVQLLFWYPIFFVSIRYFFHFLDSGYFFVNEELLEKQKPAGKITGRLIAVADRYAQQLHRMPFRTVFLTMLVVHIPYMIFSYPGIFMGDSATQIAQFPFQTTGLSNHHPVIHTLFLGLCLQIGGILGSWNLGAFLFCMIQTLFMFAVMAYAVQILMEIQADRKVYLGIIVYYIIHPRISSYLFLVSKDILYADFVVLFFLAFFRLLSGGMQNMKRERLLLGVAVVGMVIMRNDGIFVVVLTLLVAMLYRPFRKKALVYLTVVVSTVTILNTVLYPIMKVTPGSIGEMLSVPFQQTARYLLYYGEDVTSEQIEVIDQVLDYDTLAENYNPKLSDAVKRTYHGTFADLLNYFGVWFEMLLRHPDAYIQATMNNYYQYFYPGPTLFNNYSYSWSAQMMEEMNASFGSDFHFPVIWDTARKTLETVRETFYSLPVVSLLNKPAPYVWIALLFIVYCCRKKSLVGFIFSMPMIVQILIFITGPTNGYYCRYEYPMLVYLPLVVVLGRYLIGNCNIQIPCLAERTV